MNAKKINSDETNMWAEELRLLAESAGSFEEKRALECFRSAMAPFLNDPKRMRTLLSKIAQDGGGFARMGLISSKQFESEHQMKELAAKLGIEVTLE